MKTKEDFDEIIRARFSEQVFPFDEANWERAEEIIDTGRSKKKRRKFILIFTSGWIAGILFMLPFIFYKTEDSRQISENRPDYLPFFSLKPDSENSFIQNKIVPSAAENTNTENENKSQSNDGDNITDLNNNNPKSNKILTHTNNNSSDVLFTEKTEPIQPEISSNSIGKSIEEEEEENNTSDRNRFSLIEKMDKRTFIYIPQFYYPTATDSLQKLTASVKPQRISSGKEFLSQLYINTGVAYNPGWRYNNGREGNGINPVLGIGLSYPVYSFFSLAGGLQYTGIGNLSFSEVKVNNEFPDFGMNTISTVYTVRRLHFIQIPLRLAGNINTKNSVEFGGAFSYLFNSTSQVKSYYLTYSGKTLISDKSEPGYVSGLNIWDIALSAAYRRRLNEKFSISGEFNFGLSDIKLNDYPQNVSGFTERSTHFKIMLSYKLHQ